MDDGGVTPARQPEKTGTAAGHPGQPTNSLSAVGGFVRPQHARTAYMWHATALNAHRRQGPHPHLQRLVWLVIWPSLSLHHHEHHRQPDMCLRMSRGRGEPDNARLLLTMLAAADHNATRPPLATHSVPSEGTRITRGGMVGWWDDLGQHCGMISRVHMSLPAGARHEPRAQPPVLPTWSCRRCSIPGTYTWHCVRYTRTA